MNIGPDIQKNDDTRRFDSLSAITRDGPQLDRIHRRVQQFMQHSGRRPRIMVCQTHPGGRNKTVNRMGSILAQWGFDVDIGPMEKSPEQIALMAQENDVHMVVVLSIPKWIHRESTILLDELRKLNAADILVSVFGSVPEVANGSGNRSSRRGTEDLMVFNPKTAADVIFMLDNLTRKK